MTETEGEMMERKKRSENGYGIHSTVVLEKIFVCNFI